MHMYNFLCSDSLLYTSFFFFLLYKVFIHVIVHVGINEINNYSLLRREMKRERELISLSGEGRKFQRRMVEGR